MSQDAMTQVLTRMAEDGDFADLLQADPSAALGAYDLTAAERQLLRTQVEQSGSGAEMLSQRLSKSALLTFGGGGHAAMSANLQEVTTQHQAQSAADGAGAVHLESGSSLLAVTDAQHPADAVDVTATPHSTAADLHAVETTQSAPPSVTGVEPAAHVALNPQPIPPGIIDPPPDHGITPDQAPVSAGADLHAVAAIQPGQDVAAVGSLPQVPTPVDLHVTATDPQPLTAASWTPPPDPTHHLVAQLEPVAQPEPVAQIVDTHPHADLQQPHPVAHEVGVTDASIAHGALHRLPADEAQLRAHLHEIESLQEREYRVQYELDDLLARRGEWQQKIDAWNMDTKQVQDHNDSQHFVYFDDAQNARDPSGDSFVGPSGQNHDPSTGRWENVLEHPLPVPDHSSEIAHAQQQIDELDPWIHIRETGITEMDAQVAHAKSAAIAALHQWGDDLWLSPANAASEASNAALLALDHEISKDLGADHDPDKWQDLGEDLTGAF